MEPRSHLREMARKGLFAQQLGNVAPCSCDDPNQSIAKYPLKNKTSD